MHSNSPAATISTMEAGLRTETTRADGILIMDATPQPGTIWIVVPEGVQVTTQRSGTGTKVVLSIRTSD